VRGFVLVGDELGGAEGAGKGGLAGLAIHGEIPEVAGEFDVEPAGELVVVGAAGDVQGGCGVVDAGLVMRPAAWCQVRGPDRNVLIRELIPAGSG
jgi:hypothetical protein